MGGAVAPKAAGLLDARADHSRARRRRDDDGVYGTRYRAAATVAVRGGRSPRVPARANGRGAAASAIVSELLGLARPGEVIQRSRVDGVRSARDGVGWRRS